jgi:hypothetical protein
MMAFPALPALAFVGLLTATAPGASLERFDCHSELQPTCVFHAACHGHFALRTGCSMRCYKRTKTSAFLAPLGHATCGRRAPSRPRKTGPDGPPPDAGRPR